VALITVCVWKWGRKFTRDHVKRMQSMLQRHLSLPHRIVCITDAPHDVPSGVTSAPLPKIHAWDYKCLRRLWILSPQASRLGDRLLQLDLDMLICDTIDPLVDRPEPFVVWKSDSCCPHKYGYNPSVMLLTASAKSDIWHDYMANPKGVIRAAEKAGWWARTNSDQGVMTHLLQGHDVPVWTREDGIDAYRVIAGKRGQRGKTLPPGVRVVSFHGPRDPSDPALHVQSPWILEHWR
jgi:hypothetical protein